MSTVETPGVHGPAGTGMHGMGVKTPSAAAVAAATSGFAIDSHSPKGGMFTTGIWSMMFAAGVVAMTLFVGRTFRVEGAIPNVHIIMAPVVTCIPMAIVPPA
jgi:hypothetical protein